MQSRRFNATLGSSQLLCSVAKTLVFAIICGAFKPIGAQHRDFPGDIVFPGPVSLKSGNQSADGNSALVQLELAHRLNDIDTLEEFLQMLEGVPENERTFLASRFHGGEERSNGIVARPAKCEPELQSVSLREDSKPGTIIYPSCTRIKRCGGCCNTPALSCQPTATEMRNFEVVTSTTSLRFLTRRIIAVEEHTACKCDCRIKEEDCNERQRYDRRNCMCVCNNIDEKDKCLRNNNIKIWDMGLCVCSCRNVEACNTGYYFDHNTCRCRQITFPRPLNRFTSTKGSNYNYDNIQRPETPVIIPFDASDPRRKHKEDPEYK